MKKIINKLLIVSIGLVGCGKSNNEDNSIALDTNPTFVIGIGKVLPEGGIVELSTVNGSRVLKSYKKIGDTVQVGDVLFNMEALNQQLAVEQQQAAYQSAVQSTKSYQYDVEAAEIKLKSFKAEFEMSKRLFKNNAETAQKVFQDSIAYLEQKTALEQQRQNLKAQQASLKEQSILVKSKQLSLKEQSFKAIQGGTLLRFDVTVGAELTPGTVFGELAPLAPLVIEGELDELYANKIKVGQKVEISLVGQTTVLGNGTISFVGSSLQNKSILYETIGEGSDRRVRRFTIQINGGEESLLINQKVECKIIL